MKPIAVLIFLAVGATANTYGYSGYGQQGYGGYDNSARSAPITSYDRNLQPGAYDQTSFSTGNGISASHNVAVVRGRASSYMGAYGQMVQTDSSLAMNGHSYHTSPEGLQVGLTWTADENGFRADGAHLPRSVPLPPDHAEAHRQALAAVGLQGYPGALLGSGYGY